MGWSLTSASRTGLCAYRCPPRPSTLSCWHKSRTVSKQSTRGRGIACVSARGSDVARVGQVGIAKCPSRRHVRGRGAGTLRGCRTGAHPRAMSRSTTVRTPAAELDLPGDTQVRHSVRGLPLAKFRRKRAAVPMPGPQWCLDSRGHHGRLAGDRGALIRNSALILVRPRSACVTSGGW